MAAGDPISPFSDLDMPPRWRTSDPGPMLENLNLDRLGFNNLVQSAWEQGCADAEADEQSREASLSSSAPAPSQSVCAPSQSVSAPELRSCEIPPGIVSAVMASVGLRPALVAGMPLPVFWSRVLAMRSHSKEDPKLSVQRMLDFRRKYGWPLTISTQHVARALRSGMQRFLPARDPSQRSIVTYVFRNADTTVCALEEYQMLSMFMLEAALRSGSADGGGLTVIVDLRGISSAFARAIFASFSDVARSVAMVSGTLPAKISRVQLIEGDNSSRAMQTVISMLFSKLGRKMVSRVGRGGVDAAVDAIGAAELPKSLGGDRDDDADWNTWLRSWHEEEVCLGLRAREASEPAQLDAHDKHDMLDESFLQREASASSDGVTPSVNSTTKISI